MTAKRTSAFAKASAGRRNRLAATHRFRCLAATRLCLCLTALSLCVGCTHVGPGTVGVDRFNYSKTIADSWKQQTLLNIVKLRYMDLPVFVEVASVVSGYSMQTGVTVGGVLSSDKAVQGNYGSIGGQAIYTDRPTITYVPMTGETFLRGLVTPIHPKNIFFMLEAGYAADFILGLTVEGLNGVRNRSTVGETVREADPEFIRVLSLLRDVQAAGAVGMRVEEDKAKGSTAVLLFRHDNVSADILGKSAEIRRLLKLSTDQKRLVITYSPVGGAENELAVDSRSMLQIMSAFASYLDVPAEHLKEHSVVPSFEDIDPERQGNAVRIYSGKEKPKRAFASVQYQGYWFWIENSDWQTKRALTAIMFFFTLSESGASENLPLITIPAQ